MRCLIFAPVFMLSACQGDEPGNTENAGPTKEVVSLDRDANHSNAVAAGPDTTVSSNSPQTTVSQPVKAGADCPVIRSAEWHAHVDAMPGPNANPQLNVSGKVTVPTGGYRLALRMGEVMESYPVQVIVYLDVVPPKGMATQALQTHEVHGSWRSEERVGSVTIRCGRQVLARLSDIETAL